MHVIYSTLIQELHAFAKEKQYQRVVLGLSGGLDSALALCLAVRAFGAKNVTALILPEIGITPHEEVERAKLLAEHFACTVHYQPINNFLVDFHFVSWERTAEAEQHLRAHLRSVLIEYYAHSAGAMILGTANKSDFKLGLGTKSGAFTGQLHVLGDLYKSDVVDLARYFSLPAELIDEIENYQGVPWTTVDDILRQLEDKVDPDAMIAKGMEALLIHKIMRLIQENETIVKTMPVIHVGRITDSIKKAQKAEAESLR